MALGIAALTGLTVLAGCGSGAVSTSASLDSLGSAMASPARATSQQLTDTSGGRQTVQDDATKDRACDGGHRRVYRAMVVGPRDQPSNKDERNVLNLVSQAGLKKGGVKVLTDLGKDGSTVPATIDYANDPSDAARKRTYRVEVALDATTFTWRITGKTACVQD